MEAIKGTLRADANNLNNEIEKFQLRLDAIKTKEENLDNLAIVEANVKMINETTAFLTDFNDNYYFFDMNTKVWSEKFDLPAGFSRSDVLMGDDLCSTFEFKESPVVVLAAGNKDRNGISLLHLDNMADGWISGPNLPTSPNYSFSMLTTPSKDGVLKMGGIGGKGWETFDSIWKLTCQETLNNCSWEEQPSKMLLPKFNYLAFWLPNSFCPAG